MQDDSADKDDGAGDEHHADHMHQGIGEHDAVEEVVGLPLLLFAEIGVVNAGGDGQPVGGHDEGDAHEDDGEHEPDQGVTVVRAQHGGGGDRAGADDDAGGNQARADALEQLAQRQSLDAFTHEGAGAFLFFHYNLLALFSSQFLQNFSV